MRRILLAFLALLGFAAQVGPVQARVAGSPAAQVDGTATMRRAANALAARVTDCGQQVARADVRGRAGEAAVPAHGVAPAVPGVLIGIDRAHE